MGSGSKAMSPASDAVATMAPQARPSSARPAALGRPMGRAATLFNKSLVLREPPAPPPARGQVLVRVRAAGLNNADLLQVAGGSPAPSDSPPDIPGLELAGEI